MISSPTIGEYESKGQASKETPAAEQLVSLGACFFPDEFLMPSGIRIDHEAQQAELAPESLQEGA